MAESPILETPQETPKEEKTPQPEIDVDALMTTLESAGIKDVRSLEGKFEASRQAGNLANQLGNARAEIAELKRMMESQPRQHKPSYNEFDMENMGEGQTIDLEDTVTRSVEKALTKREQKQLQAQQHLAQTWNAINSDPDYGLVKEVWEEKLKDPNFVFQIHSGVKDPSKAYQETVRGFYKGLLKRSHETINQLRGTPLVPPTPHVESDGSRGGPQPQNLVHEGPSNESPLRQKQKKLLEATAKGYLPGDDEILDTFDDVIDQAFSNQG